MFTPTKLVVLLASVLSVAAWGGEGALLPSHPLVRLMLGCFRVHPLPWSRCLRYCQQRRSRCRGRLSGVLRLRPVSPLTIKLPTSSILTLCSNSGLGPGGDVNPLCNRTATVACTYNLSFSSSIRTDPCCKLQMRTRPSPSRLPTFARPAPSGISASRPTPSASSPTYLWATSLMLRGQSSTTKRSPSPIYSVGVLCLPISIVSRCVKVTYGPLGICSTRTYLQTVLVI